MSDQSQGQNWWQASDGRWYPPSATTEPPAPGWWLASDGQWYPPRDEPPVPGWWLASDGRWYPPAEQDADERQFMAVASTGPVAAPAPPEGSPMLLAGVPATLTAPAPVRRRSNGSAGGASHAGGTTTTSPARRRERPSRAGRATLLAPRTPQEQIARRDTASRQDAQVVAAARAKAAQGALAALRAQIAAESNGAPASTEAAPASRAPAAAAAAPPATDAAVPAPDTTEEGDGATLVRSPTAVPGAGRPLLEVRPSPVATDLDRFGERLAIYEDRVSVLDRHDNVKERIDGHEIADVVLARRFTGWSVTIEPGAGAPIVVKGLRQDHAEEVRDLIMGRTRRTGPVPARGRRGSAPSPAPAPAPDPAPAAAEVEITDVTDAATPVDTVHLLAMLDELHQARVLSDDELAAKRRQVETLAVQHPLTPAP